MSTTNNIDESLITSLTPEQAWHYNVFPIKMLGKTLVLGIAADKAGSTIEEELEMILGISIKVEKSDPVENPRKLTPFRQNKLTPFGHFKLTPLFRLKLTP